MAEPSLSFLSDIVNTLQIGELDDEPATTVIRQLLAGMVIERDGFQMDSEGLAPGSAMRRACVARFAVPAASLRVSCVTLRRVPTRGLSHRRESRRGGSCAPFR